MADKIRSHWQIVLVILLTFFALLPLFHSGFFPMHDDEQVGRLYNLHQDITSGHIPPRLTQDLGFGYDYPLFNFYPPLVYYIAEVFVLAGFSYITAIKIMIGLGFVLAAIGMYLFSKEYFGKTGGLLSAVAYTYAPYHAVDVYVRGALPEFWAFVFVPLLFWAIYKLSQKENTIYIVITAFFAACLVLTHNLVAMMTSIFIGIYFIYLWIHSTEKRKFLLQMIISALLAIGLSAYFWIPALQEKKYTMVDLLVTELANYNLHFVYLRQFWDSPWGYGGSLYGLDDGLSFQIGKSQLLLFIFGLFSAVFLYKKKDKKSWVVLLFSLLVLVSMYLITFYSKPFWDLLPPFWYIQFPWRFLLFTAFTLSFVLGGTVYALRKQKIVSSVFLFIALGLLIGTNFTYFTPEKYLGNVTDQSYTSPEVIRWRTSIMAFEYTPRGIATKKSAIGNTIIDITQKDIATSSYQVLSGEMTIIEKENKPHEKIYTIFVKRPGQFRVNVFSFPGWKVYVNDSEVRYTDNNKYKLLTIPLKEGRYVVKAVFTDTAVRLVANTISAISWILSLSVICYLVFYKKKFL